MAETRDLQRQLVRLALDDDYLVVAKLYEVIKAEEDRLGILDLGERQHASRKSHYWVLGWSRLRPANWWWAAWAFI
jgi:hypothetical protein